MERDRAGEIAPFPPGSSPSQFFEVMAPVADSGQQVRVCSSGCIRKTLITINARNWLSSESRTQLASAHIWSKTRWQSAKSSGARNSHWGFRLSSQRLHRGESAVWVSQSAKPSIADAGTVRFRTRSASHLGNKHEWVTLQPSGRGNSDGGGTNPAVPANG